MRSGLIFVLYQPGEQELRNLAHARSACEEIVVVDNTPGPSAGLEERLRDDGYRVLANRNRGGLAGAYNRGAAELLARGCDLVFLLDQDSSIPDDYFVRMAEDVEGLAGTPFIVGPLVHEIEMDRDLLAPPPSRPVEPPPPGLTPTQLVISSGSAFTAEAYHLLGPFREDFFIELVDVEYCYRATRAGVPVYVNPAVVLHQTTGAISRHGTRFTTNHVAWRRYYLARNAVYTGKEYAPRSWSPRVLSYPLGDARMVLRFEDAKLRKLIAIACGVSDGLLGRLGLLEERHPRLKRWLLQQH